MVSLAPIDVLYLIATIVAWVLMIAIPFRFDSDRGVRAFTFAVRWTMVGIVVGVAAEVYLSTTFAMVQIAIVSIAFLVLEVMQYILLRSEAKRKSKKKTLL